MVKISKQDKLKYIIFGMIFKLFYRIKQQYQVVQPKISYSLAFIERRSQTILE